MAYDKPKSSKFIGEKFITEDTGNHQSFDTGARRDDRKGKGRFDLIPPAALRRWAELMERGAEKYGEDNWQLGMPFSRYLDSAMRHLNQYREGETTEDHLAAVLFNIGAIIAHEQAIENGELNSLLDDRF